MLSIPPAWGAYTFPNALSTTPGVKGIVVTILAPSGANAWFRSFITHAGAPAVPVLPRIDLTRRSAQ